MQQPIYNRDRDKARTKLMATRLSQIRLREKIEAERDLPDFMRKTFTNIDPNFIISHCEHVLRWMHCAPEGANFSMAPLQDKRGVPCGDAWSENVGPSKAVRQRRIERELCPLCGQPDNCGDCNHQREGGY